MRDVKLDRGAPTQLYEQVAAEIRRAIADGEAKPGERLPPAKDMAAVLGDFARAGLLNLVGGCCGTTPEHIAAIARAVEGIAPRPIPRLADAA